MRSCSGYEQVRRITIIHVPPSQTSWQLPRRSASALRRCPVCWARGWTSSPRVEQKPWCSPPFIGLPPTENTEMTIWQERQWEKKKKAEIRRPGLSAVRKDARWHGLSCHYAMICIITSNLLNTLPKKGSVIEHTSSNSSKARNTLSRPWRSPTRKQTRPLRQCGNRRWDRTVNKFITKCLGGFII